MSLSDDLRRIERQAETHYIKVSDLRAELIGCNIVVNCQIIGEASQKAVPKIVELNCKKCGYTEVLDYTKMAAEGRSVFLASVVFGKLESLGDLAANPICSKGLHRWRFRVIDFMDFSILFCRDLLDPLMRFDSRIYQTLSLIHI